MFGELHSVFPQSRKLKSTAGILIIWIIAINAPIADDLSVASCDIALLQARVVPAVHPLIVASKIYWVKVFHGEEDRLFTCLRKLIQHALGISVQCMRLSPTVAQLPSMPCHHMLWQAPESPQYAA